jgi:chromosome segregation ATPase
MNQSNYHRELSDLQQTNVNLQSALNSNTHETKKGLSREPLELIKRLQFQGDEYTRKIETERRLITNLESNLKVLRSKVEQQRMQMGGIGGAERKQKEVARRLSQMENRLDNALIKYNSRVAENRHLKSDIDNSRRQRLVYDNIYTGLELELAKKKKNMASLISQTSLAMQKQDRLKSKLEHLQKQIEGEQNEFDKKWHSLGTEIAMGREAHTLKLKKELEAKGLLTDGSENIDSNETSAGNEGTTTGDGDGANGTEGGKANAGEQTIERKTKRKLARGAWAIAKEKAQIHMSSEKIQAYEVAFEKIREITGIADIEVLVDRFIEAEERNFSTFKYISHLNKELEKLDTQIHEARTEIERFRGQGVETDSQRKKILRELESKLHRTETRTKDFDDRHNRVATLLTSVKKRVQDIFQRIGCRNSVAAGFVGNQGVTDR